MGKSKKQTDNNLALGIGITDSAPVMMHLPWPPSVNSYWARTRVGMMRSARATKYIKLVQNEAYETGTLNLNINTHVKLTIDLYPPDNRRRDIDNVLKALLDALTHAKIYADDYLVSELAVKRYAEIKPPSGQVIVTVNRAGL